MQTPSLAIPVFLGLVLLASRAGAGLLAHYSFDSGFSDGSGNSNHLSAAAGTPSITATPGEFAFGGGALDLNKAENEYLLPTSVFSFNTTDSWSVSFWARRRPGAGIATGMVVGDNTTTDSFIWLPDNSSQVQGLRFRPVGVGTTNNNDYATGHDNNFHHWVVVADGGGTIRVYRDNVDLGTRSPNGGTDFRINAVGSGYTGTTQLFDGQIDELYIFNEAIDATKVGELFAGVTDNTPPTLAGGDISDDQAGGPVNVGAVVTYTVNFSEDMNAATVDAADFGNAGTAAFVIGAITEISPGVFTIEVTGTSAGTLRLSLVAGATVNDAAGNGLDASAAITDDNTISVMEPPGEPAVRRIRVFLLGGQSNADGRAAPSGLPTSPVNLQLPQDDVDFYENEAGGLTTLRPLAEFGPEITLGRRLADAIADGTFTRVAMIKYAVGATDLANDWKGGGDATTSGDGPRYVSFQGVVSAGLAALAATYPDAVIEIEGMLWVQGERDAGDAQKAANYQANLAAFIADVRLTYGAGLRFVVSRLSSGQTSINATNLATVRAAQTAVAAADPLAALLDTDGFGMKTDNLHFDAVGQQQIGNGAAEWLLDFHPMLLPLKISRTQLGEIAISVERAFSGFRYTLQGNAGLRPENWVDLETVTASGPTVTFTRTPPGGATKEFYRVARTKAP